jgi:hypothetical protein
MSACIGSWDNFNLLWATALNKADKDETDYFVMLHSDMEPQKGWLDVLVEEIERLNADIVTTIIPQKAATGVTSSGIGTFADPYLPHRRFTMREIWAEDAPETFNEEMLGLDDGQYLLHNDGCCIMNPRSPVWRQTEMRGNREFLICSFEWIRGIEKTAKEYVARGESEDWYFSRALHLIGANAYMTRKIQLAHCGQAGYANQGQWGTDEHDEPTRSHWDKLADVEDESGRAIGATNSTIQENENGNARKDNRSPFHKVRRQAAQAEV